MNAITGRKPKMRRKIVLVCVLFAVGVAAVLGTTVARSSGPPTTAGWAPGKAAGLTAAMKLPPVAHPPAGLTGVIQSSSGLIGGNSSTALSSLRLVRAGLGRTHSDLYVYNAGDNGWCLALWQRQTQCPTAGSAATPGALFYLSPGGPGYVGQGDNAPAAVAGIVADNIKSVALTDQGVTETLPIVNNAFYADLTDDPASAFDVQLVLGYADGSTRTATLDNPGAATVPGG